MHNNIDILGIFQEGSITKKYGNYLKKLESTLIFEAIKPC